MAKANEGGQEHALPKDKEANSSVNMVNTDKGGLKHILPRDEEANSSVSMVNIDKGDKITHFLETRVV